MQKPDQLANIIEQCRKGRPEAFNWLLDNYGQRLYAYFLRTTGSTHDAEDLLQEIFVRLIENIRAYQHQGRFEHWLFRIAANLARDRIRRLQRGPSNLSLDTTDPEKGNLTEQLRSTEPPPDETLQLDELHDELQDALAQLPQLDREIIVMRHYSQMSFKDIASHFHMPIGTALAKVHRGLKRLRSIMQPKTKIKPEQTTE